MGRRRRTPEESPWRKTGSARVSITIVLRNRSRRREIVVARRVLFVNISSHTGEPLAGFPGIIMRRGVASAVASLVARGAEALPSWSAPGASGVALGVRSVDPALPRCARVRPARRLATDADAGSGADADGSSMRFGSGLSNNETLSVAVAEAVAEVKATLGHDRVPSWVQLAVSADYPDPTRAAAFVAECFAPAGGANLASPNHPPPAIFGGVVTGCIGGRGQTMDGPSVSIVAAAMGPDVEVIPFTADDASLPKQVTPAQWARLMASGEDSSSPRHSSSASSSGDPGVLRESVAVLALCRPDFIEIDDLARRVHGVAPASVVVGGAVKPGGALFANGAACDESIAASGVFVRGRSFRVTAHSLHACRPVGRAVTLTRAVDGHVLDLDGRSAGDVLSRTLQELPDHVSGLPVMLGVGEGGVDKQGEGDGDGGRDGDGVNPKGVDKGGPRASRDVRGRVVDDGSVAAGIADVARMAKRPAPGEKTEKRAKAGKIVEDVTGKGGSRSAARTHADVEADARDAARDGYASGGTGYVYRDIVMADRETGGIFIGRHSLENGAPVRLHVRDNEWGRARSRELMRLVHEEREARGGGLRGAVMYTCVSGDRLHAANFRDRVPGVELGGGYTSGELGPSAVGRQSHMHSHTSVLGLFWDA